MDKFNLLNFNKEVFSKLLRSLKIIYISYFIFSTSYLFILLIIFPAWNSNIINTEITSNNIFKVQLYSLFHIILFIISLFFSNYMYNRTFTNDSVLKILNDDKYNHLNANEKYYIIIKNAKIVQLGILQGPVFIGLLTCFIGITEKVFFKYYYYWINIISYIYLCYYLIKDFPNHDGIVTIFKNKLGHYINFSV